MKLAILVAVTFLSALSFSQSLKEADNLFGNQNYEGALDQYLELLKEDKNNVDLSYKIAVCYLNTNIDKSKAVPYLESIKDKAEANPNTLFLLARAYQLAYEFDKSVELYNSFREKASGNEDNLASIDRQIAYCQNAIEYMKFPRNVDITNLGDKVNSPYPDYYPFVPINESFLVFNSRRQNGEELPDGRFTSDAYLCHVKDGEYTKAELLSNNINTREGNEEIAGLNAAGTKAVFYIENPDGSGDLYSSNVIEGKFDDPVKLNKKINSKYTEIAASISADGNSIYFASDMPGGYGGTDLYVSRILPNGKWGPAQNLGANINTDQDEDFPDISPDGKKLYFSSRGHSSMGGYDIFTATWDDSKLKFMGVTNMRFPINTPDDDMNFIVSETGRYGYMSSLRSDGYGDLDIYRVTFNDIDPKFTVISGTIKGDDGEVISAEDVYLAVIDKQTDEVYGDYKPNALTNRYVMILPPGEFEITMDITGYEFYTEIISIKDKISFKSAISKDITIKKNK